MNARGCQEYAERVANNMANTLTEVTSNPDGSSKGLPGDVTAGVLTAQSNLAIAAALMWVAAELKDHR